MVCWPLDPMTDVTRMLSPPPAAIPNAAAQLLPLVYAELRRLAAQAARVGAAGPDAAGNRPGTQRPTCGWPAPRATTTPAGSTGVAAAILRRSRRGDAANPHRGRAGGAIRSSAGCGRARESLDALDIAAPAESQMTCWSSTQHWRGSTAADPQAAQLVKLRYFAGLTIPQAAEMLDISPRKADFIWSFARAWLRRDIDGG